MSYVAFPDAALEINTEKRLGVLSVFLSGLCDMLTFNAEGAEKNAEDTEST